MSASTKPKLILFRLEESGEDYVCVSVSSYQEAIEMARREYHELDRISPDRIRFQASRVIDGNQATIRLTESGFMDALDLYEPMKVVTIHVTSGLTPAQQELLRGF